jgi:integrase
MSEEVSLRTTASIRALLARLGSLPADYDKVHFDSALPGYGLRVRGSGAHSLMVQYAIAGRTRRVVVGKFGSVDPGKAYNEGKDLLAKVRLGHDPAAEKELARIRAGETFGALLPRFLEHQRARLKPRSYVETERHLKVHAKTLHGSPIEAVTRRAIAARLAEIERHTGPAARNRVRASLSAYFTWAAKEGYLDANPVAFTNKAEEKARERVLSDEELRIIWLASDDSQFGAIVKLLMLTGARRSEIGGLTWSEVPPILPLATLPPVRTKSGREHFIPLSEPALTILRAQPKRTNPDGTPREHIFGTIVGCGYQNWSRGKADLDARIVEMNHGKALEWRLHDFRRSLSTALHERFGVPPHVVEVLLGHVGGHKAGVAGTYNKAIYLEERRRALERWGAHIMTLIGKPTKATAVNRGPRHDQFSRRLGSRWAASAHRISRSR